MCLLLTKALATQHFGHKDFNAHGVVQRMEPTLDDLIHAVCGRLLRDLADEERTIYGIAKGAPTCST